MPYRVRERICIVISIADTYDLIMGLGVLLPNHISDDAFEEMIRVTKPGRCTDKKLF